MVKNESFNTDKQAGYLVLGQRNYADLSYMLNQPFDAPVIQLENRIHIAEYLENQGDLDGALTAFPYMVP